MEASPACASIGPSVHLPREQVHVWLRHDLGRLLKLSSSQPSRRARSSRRGVDMLKTSFPLHPSDRGRTLQLETATPRCYLARTHLNHNPNCMGGTRRTLGLRAPAPRRRGARILLYTRSSVCFNHSRRKCLVEITSGCKSGALKLPAGQACDEGITRLTKTLLRAFEKNSRDTGRWLLSISAGLVEMAEVSGPWAWARLAASRSNTTATLSLSR